MAILTPQRPSAAGVELTTAAASAGGDSFPNDGSTAFRIVNSSGSSRTVTFDAPNVCSFGVVDDVHNYVVVVPDGKTYEVGPFTQGRFNDATGKVQVSYSSEAGLAVAAVSR